MTGSARRCRRRPDADVDVDVEEAVTWVARDVPTWLPDLRGSGARARAVNVRERPLGRMVLMHVEGGGVQRAVLVKMRRSGQSRRLVDQFSSRPVLRPPGYGDDRRDCHLEYQGLKAIEEQFTPLHDRRFEVIRPYGLNDGLAAISMAFSTSLTLRDLARRAPASYTSTVPWHHAGAWLRRFHDCAKVQDIRSRRSTSDEIVQLLQGYGQFLSARTRDRDRDLLMRFVDAVSQKAKDVLPERLPMGLGHGDFVPSNILVSQAGAVSVIDPLPRCRVPIYEDLGRLLVGGRLLARPRYPSGRPRPRLPEPALLTGYFGDSTVPVPSMRVFLALTTLDRWADIVSRQPAHFLRKRRRDVHLVVMHRHFGRELRSQLKTLGAGHDARWDSSG